MVSFFDVKGIDVTSHNFLLVVSHSSKVICKGDLKACFNHRIQSYAGIVLEARDLFPPLV